MSVLIRTDVTSVKLYKNTILAGIGSFLCKFDRESGLSIQKIRSLNGQKIYGIVPSNCNTKLLIFGGKQFAILKEIQSTFSHHVEAVFCDDWIHSAIWLSNNKVALLTAHNVVMIWDVMTISLLTKHLNRDNCILYSGLLKPLQNDILVFSGTVFSQVILQWCGDEQPLHYLKGHKGVIFSINCDLERGIIVTTSDDRSMRIWSVKSSHSGYDTKRFWQKAVIDCVHNLYGHAARVMRNCLTTNCIISVGEDSAICFWDYNGKLLKKTMSHKNSPIWCLDADESDLVTGGGDCGVVLHPLSSVTGHSRHEVIDIDVPPKKVLFTARNNILIARDDNLLNYYDTDLKEIHQIKLNHTSTYRLVGLSFCKQILAVADMNGKLDIFIENCKGDPALRKIIDTQLNLAKVFSMQWASNRHLVFCCEGGVITVVASEGNSIKIFADYLLPPCKERWLTSCALSDTRDALVAGDRCGHVHLYRSGHRRPVATVKTVHGRYGATSIDIRNDTVTTTGRDGTVKYFSMNDNNLKYMSCKAVDFQWVEKLLDVDGNYVCGFRERSFVVYDSKENVELLEVPCGGGHRSWDAVRYFDKHDDSFEGFIRLAYLKNSNIFINTFRLSKIVSRNIVSGTHSKEINCLKWYRSGDAADAWFITGGEDTTLRVSRSARGTGLRDEAVYRHLSNVRSLKILTLSDDVVLVASAGGRAQICLKTVTFNENLPNNRVISEELVTYQIKGTDRERRGDQNWRNRSIAFDPETRIMDIELLRINDGIIVYAACSDAALRTFELKREATFVSLQEVNYHKTCILKVRVFSFGDRELLLSCTTRGEVAFWEIGSETGMLGDEPAFILKTNKSGINGVDVRVIDEARALVATAGDDNAIHFVVVEVHGDKWKIIDSLEANSFHCSQITGLSLGAGLCVTAGVDQRVTLVSWRLSEDGIQVEFVDQKYSDVADVHGMEVLQVTGSRVTVCVYGKGVEVIEIFKK